VLMVWMQKKGEGGSMACTADLLHSFRETEDGGREPPGQEAAVPTFGCRLESVVREEGV
jgi:hypothetical protein